jgi:hypothetical protein
MRSTDSQSYSNIAASTSPFTLQPGGLYGVDCVATFGGGSVKLQKLAQDGSTYVSVSSGTDFTTAGYATVNLPTGTYRLTIATATAAYVNIGRVAGG